MIPTLTKIKVTNYYSLPVNIGQVYQIGEEEIVLFRLKNGEVKAIENKSPHPKGGTVVDGLVSGVYIYCPFYDWKISLLTGKVQEPDFGEIKIFQVEIEDDEVYLII